MNATTTSPPTRSDWLPGLAAASVAVLVSAVMGLTMATLAPGLGADFVGKLLTGWAIGLMLTLPASWLWVVGARHRRQRQPPRHSRVRHTRLA